jgi:hypothetical protein
VTDGIDADSIAVFVVVFATVTAAEDEKYRALPEGATQDNTPAVVLERTKPFVLGALNVDTIPDESFTSTPGVVACKRTRVEYTVVDVPLTEKPVIPPPPATTYNVSGA